MKWISKDKKQILYLDKIGYWKYSSIEDVRDRIQAPLPDEETSELEIYFGGDSPLMFYGEVADEIYNILQSQKEVL